MLINNLPSNNSRQNFGFNVKVNENNRLVNMADSFLFKTLPAEAVDLFEQKAQNILPDKTVVLKYKPRKAPVSGIYDVDFYSDNKKCADYIFCEPRMILNLLKKALNPHTRLHSDLFYEGGRSPQEAIRVEKIRKAFK